MSFPRKSGITALIILGAVTLGGCGGGSPDSSPPPDYKKDLAGSPPPLAAVYEQGNQLLDGGKEAFDKRIAGLKGFPIVVNIWGSWCGPCIVEFPFFQQASARLGKKVAFLGVNSEDSKDQANALLRDFPVPYPSYVDEGDGIFNSLVPARGLPVTVFFDRNGKQTYAKRGGYSDQEALLADIQNYAIEGNPG